MNTEDLRALAQRAETVKGREGVRLAELHDRIRTARRHRAAATAAASAAAVLVLVVGGRFLAETSERAEEPIKRPTRTASTQTATETLAIPAGQVTITPDIRPGDVRGWKTLGVRTNTQPGYQGVTDLSMTVTEHAQGGSTVDFFCHAGPETWWSSSHGDGGAGYGPCSLGDPVTPPPPGDLGPTTLFRFAEPVPVRLFVFAPTEAQRQCLHRRGSVADCQIRPAASTDATFGFVIYEHPANRSVLHVWKYLDFDALTILDGQEYLTERAVVAAPGSDRLVIGLDGSDRELLVSLFAMTNKRGQECMEDYVAAHLLPGTSRESADRALVDESVAFCSVEYALKVDGSIAPKADESLGFGDQFMRAPAGAREVTVDVTHGDPRNERLAVVIWKARS